MLEKLTRKVFAKLFTNQTIKCHFRIIHYWQVDEREKTKQEFKSLQKKKIVENNSLQLRTRSLEICIQFLVEENSLKFNLF